MPPPCRHVHVVSGKGTAEQAAGGASWASPLARNRAARSLLVLAALSCGPSRERVAASGCAAGFHDFVDAAEAPQFYCTDWVRKWLG